MPGQLAWRTGRVRGGIRLPCCPSCCSAKGNAAAAAAAAAAMLDIAVPVWVRRQPTCCSVCKCIERDICCYCTDLQMTSERNFSSICCAGRSNSVLKLSGSGQCAVSGCMVHVDTVTLTDFWRKVMNAHPTRWAVCCLQSSISTIHINGQLHSTSSGSACCSSAAASSPCSGSMVTSSGLGSSSWPTKMDGTCPLSSGI